MRTLAVAVILAIVTPVFAIAIIIAALVGWPRRDGGIYDVLPRVWARWICGAAGLRLQMIGTEHLQGGPRVVVANHVSWFDVFSIVSRLDGFKFVAKAELANIPLFGPAVRRLGHVFIERANRKAAFGAIDAAAERVAAGQSVIVFPEGTRGTSYALRPFKKGPFVLALTAGVPIVPTVIYGTREIQRKHSARISSGRVTIRFLEPIPTAEYSYDRRDELMRAVWQRMADALKTYHGVISEPLTTPPLTPQASSLSP